MTQPTPDKIMQVGTGFWPSKILLTAIQFELFTWLASVNGATGNQIKERLKLKCSERHAYDFLDTLASLGFLQREGLKDDAVYTNSVDTDIYLDKNKPSYIGGLLEMMNNRLYGFWNNLDKALLTGEAQNEVSIGQKPIFEILYADPDLLREFVNAMTGIQMGSFTRLAEEFDFSEYSTFLDAGGSAGILSLLVAKHNSHVTCTTFDLPPVEPIAVETINKLGSSDRVTAISGDFFKEPLPQADVIAMGNILHDWNEEQKLQLMRSAYDSLPTGGAFIAIEAVIDNERLANTFGLMMSLNMLIETGDGFDYTFDDFNNWASQVGFTKTDILPLVGGSSAVIAYK